MSLTDTINNTNKQKENVKTVATNIDNKLVALGGQQATSLNDVPNKIGAMIGQYKKIATLSPNKEFKGNEIYKDKNYTMNLTNVNFVPKTGFLKFLYKTSGSQDYNLTEHIVEIGNTRGQSGICYSGYQYEITVNAKLTNKTLNFAIRVSFSNSSSLAQTIDAKLLKVILIG